ncbi:MAG: FKBP-type peptidyl-prolyl cis-trans isomerase [Balneolaceae bacterium]|nr:FKBP-type peptidyl-prolyl cis-trans isomerase [Balneolaceae bacterium]MCH8549568.1 FKBP-type peptidyl-prolyl cis-trans isomerase [Balneolaceae bacterium]
MHLSVFKFLLPSILLAFLIISCDTTDPFEIPEPDFSTVPAAWDFNGVEPVEIESGLTAYILEEGEGSNSVTVRDQISAFITLRTTDGEIIYSTYNDGITDPAIFSVGNIQLDQNVFQYSLNLAYTNGLRKGLIGMREGEQRTLIVSPELGFQALRSEALHGQYREDTLQYDIEVVEIRN